LHACQAGGRCLARKAICGVKIGEDRGKKKVGGEKGKSNGLASQRVGAGEKKLGKRER
jgi:hypothetical protein